MPRLRNVRIGKTYGHLTITGECGRNRHGHQQYAYQCDCGQTGVAISSAFLSRPNVRCRSCAIREIGLARRIDIVGKTLNGWYVIEEAGKNERSQLLFLCRCVRCGTEAIKAGGTIRHIKASACKDCPPNYHFTVQEDTAIGILPDGTPFMIDAADIPLVAGGSWYLSERGYILSGNRSRKGARLHR